MTVFSVDVETSSTRPSVDALLTIGVVAIGSGNSIHLQVTKPWRARWDEETWGWWQTQSEAWSRLNNPDTSPVFHGRMGSADRLAEFVKNESNGEAIFLAKPPSFDYPFIAALLDEYGGGVNSVFSHRTLCLRSYALGKRQEVPTVHNACPHDALCDAMQQAEQYRILEQA